MRGVSLRLAVLVLACGVTAAGVVVLRQSRLQAAHEMSMAHARIHRQDEQLLDLRARIARRTTPEAVSRMLNAKGFDTRPWIPIDAASPTWMQGEGPVAEEQGDDA